MEILHRIWLNVDDRRRRDLARLGVQVENGYRTFDIAESAPDWDAWKTWIERERPSDVVQAFFSAEEVAASRHVAFEAEGQYGYPQPNEGEFGYLRTTYARTDEAPACTKCGIGYRQVAPFQLRREPSWARRDILQLNWVFDEYFVPPAIWTAVFEPFGVPCRSVNDAQGRELPGVVQIDIGELVPLETSQLVPQSCDACPVVKYQSVTRPPIPPVRTEPTAHLVKSVEWFGSGGSAYRQVIASQDLVKAMTSAGIRGVRFVPLAGGL